MNYVKRNPFTCELCGNFYSSISLLNVHAFETHSGEKPFSCDICKKHFTRMYTMTQHKKIHEGIIPEKNCPCDICGKFFSNIHKLKIHSKTHFNEKPFGNNKKSCFF